MRVVSPYGALWRTLEIPVASAAPTGWEAPGFDDSAWTSLPAPFGAAGFPACPIITTNPPATTWTKQTDRLYRRHAAFSGAVALAGPVDDEIAVWLDGTLILARTAGDTRSGPCPHRDDWHAAATVAVGDHVIAVRTWDTGSGGGNHTYFDLIATTRGGWTVGQIGIG